MNIYQQGAVDIGDNFTIAVETFVDSFFARLTRLQQNATFYRCGRYNSGSLA